MKKGRIVHIIARLNIGGPALHVSQLLKGLEDQHFETYLIHGSLAEGEGSMQDEAKSRGLKLIEIPNLGREIHPIRDIGAFVQLLLVLLKLNPDVIHTHTAKAGVLGRFSAAFLGISNVIHTYHGNVFHGYGFGRAKVYFFKTLERILSFHTSALIVLSDALKREMMNSKIGRLQQYLVLSLGFDLSRFLETQQATDPLLRDEYSISDSDKIIGFVGRLEAVKNPFFLLDLASYAKEHRILYHFVIVGDGALRKELQRRVRECALSDYFSFVGWKSNLAEIYAQLDILLMCSFNEGTPVVIIEAMAAGCPVVSSRAGGIPDIIDNGKTGYLVTDFTPSLYFEAFDKVMTCRNLISVEAREFSLATFDLNLMLKRYTDIYSFFLTDELQC